MGLDSNCCCILKQHSMQKKRNSTSDRRGWQSEHVAEDEWHMRKGSGQQ